MGEHVAIDRLGIRSKPDGPHVMEQNWENLLFLHWSFDESVIRPLVPSCLDIDTFDGKAWVGVTPFNLTGLRFLLLPPIPLLDSFSEINVRTYVLHNGVPGIYFFSLDASKMLPALGARVFFNLPYFDATIDFTKIDGEFAINMAAEAASQVQITRVYHHPWILDEGILLDLDSSLLNAAGLRDPAEEPLVHCSNGVNVQIWPPNRIV